MVGTQYKALSAKDVIKLYGDDNGGPLATRDLLAFHLRQGNIRARCSQMWESDEKSLLKALRSVCPEPIEPDQKKAKLKSISRNTWWRSIDWAADVENWDLNRGRIAVTTGLKPVHRTVVKGIRFFSADIRDHFSKNGKSRAGKPTDTLRWRRFWFEIIRLMQNGSTDFGLLGTADYTGKEKLVGKLLQAFKEQDAQYRDEQAAALSADLANKLPYALSEEAMFKEVVALRLAFGLVPASE